MKLYKAIDEQVPTYSEEELLLVENEILRDELEFRENMRSLELMETVLNCIEQEGEVSKSVEIMFGDSVEDKASFKEELEKEYNKSLESFLSDLKEKFLFGKDNVKRMIAYFKDLIKRAKNNISKIKGSKFHLTVKLPRIVLDADYAEKFLESITDGFVDKSDSKYKELESIVKEDVEITFNSAEEFLTKFDDLLHTYLTFSIGVNTSVNSYGITRKTQQLRALYSVPIKFAERRYYDTLKSLAPIVKSLSNNPVSK